METMDLFGMETAEVDDAPSGVINFIPYQKEAPEQRAMRRIRSVFQRNSPAAVMFSSGKDSSCLALLVLNTAKEFIAEGNKCPPVIVISADTGVEAPQIVALAKSEMQKMKVYASEHGIDLTVRISRPRLSDSWPVRVIGGRALPAFPDSRGDCSIGSVNLTKERWLMLLKHLRRMDIGGLQS